MSEKNYDPQMHTAEHILNGTMVKMFDIPRSFSNHVERKKSKCDYKMPKALTDEEIFEVSKQVNSIISSNLEVKEDFLTIEDAKNHYDLSRLPDLDEDTIRIVKVGDYDFCPCIGPHVENTSEIGEFRITTHSYDDGVLRIRFKLNRPQ